MTDFIYIDAVIAFFAACILWASVQEDVIP